MFQINFEWDTYFCHVNVRIVEYIYLPKVMRAYWIKKEIGQLFVLTLEFNQSISKRKQCNNLSIVVWYSWKNTKNSKEEQGGVEASTPMDDAANNIKCIAWCAYGIERIREDLSTHSFGSILRRGWTNTKGASRCGISGLRDKPPSGSSEEHKERSNEISEITI